jgi:hypothetical protein
MDRDRDGMPDRWERSHRVHAPGADADHDGLPNRFEYRARTDPRRRDSDRDHRRDGREDPDRDQLDNAGELRAGTDPRNPDTDGDGVLDGSEAGAGAREADPEPATDAEVEAENLADEIEVMDGEDVLDEGAEVPPDGEDAGDGDVLDESA